MTGTPKLPGVGRFALLPILFLSSTAFAIGSFGNGASTCASQGQWTKDALAQTEVIESTIIALRDDPNCKGIESILPRVQEAQIAFQKQAQTDSTVPGASSSDKDASIASTMIELKSILARAAAATGPEATMAYLAAGKLITKNATLIASQSPGAKAGMDYGISFMDEAMKTLPSYQLCMNKHPDQALAMVGASVQMAAAFASSGEGVTSRLGNSIANLVSFMRNSDYAKILRGPSESRYWNSMSCLVETSAQAYCQANETYKLLEFQEHSRSNATDKKNSGRSQNLLDGYYLLVREMPTISDWMQKVQIGVTPKLASDADNQSVTLDAQNNFMKAVKTIQGSYSEYLLGYQAQPNDIEAKKAYASKAVLGIYNIVINNGTSATSSGKPGDQNFFTSTQNSNYLPYYLIGRPSIPKEVLDARARTNNMADFGGWLTGADGDSGGSGFQHDLDDPDKTMKVLGERLNSLADSASQKASAYYRQRMVVDPQNLVSESLTSNNLSVVESLRNVRKYLAGLAPRAKADPDAGVKLVTSINDTMARIDRVLASYDELKKNMADMQNLSTLVNKAPDCPLGQRAQLVSDVQQILNKVSPGSGPVDFNNLDDTLKKKVSDEYAKVIGKVYDEFNVQLQRDGFLASRLTTFVKYDYSSRVRKGEDMTDYQKQIFTVAGKSILDALQKANSLNPVSTEQDLNSAQVVNTKNMEAVEQLLADNFHEAIDSANRHTGGEIRGASSIMPWAGAPAPVRVRGSGDENNAFDQFRAKLCVQTLAFDDWKEFKPYCAGSVLKSRFQADDPKNKNLVVDYNEMAKLKESGKGAKSNYVCALRNYLQQNEAYWLIHSNDN